MQQDRSLSGRVADWQYIGRNRPPGASTLSIPLGPPRKKDMRSNTHGSCVSMKKDFVTAADCPFIRKDNPIYIVAGRQHPE
jgi:hypothetical protein